MTLISLQNYTTERDSKVGVLERFEDNAFTVPREIVVLELNY